MDPVVYTGLPGVTRTAGGLAHETKSYRLVRRQPYPEEFHYPGDSCAHGIRRSAALLRGPAVEPRLLELFTGLPRRNRPMEYRGDRLGIGRSDQSQTSQSHRCHRALRSGVVWLRDKSPDKARGDMARCNRMCRARWLHRWWHNRRLRHLR